MHVVLTLSGPQTHTLYSDPSRYNELSNRESSGDTQAAVLIDVVSSYFFSIHLTLHFLAKTARARAGSD